MYSTESILPTDSHGMSCETIEQESYAPNIGPTGLNLIHLAEDGRSSVRCPTTLH